MLSPEFDVYVNDRASREANNDNNAQNYRSYLADFSLERLSSHAYPREIEFVDTLPKTLSGKIQRFKLRARAAGEAETS